MINALSLLLADFLSTLVFLAIAAATGQARIAVIAAVATGLVQLLLRLLRRQPIDPMLWFGLLLTLIFGAATIVLHDPRFIMAKPSIIHFVLGTIMLRRGWMIRYLPEGAVRMLPPSLIIRAGQAWALLMFGLGAANLVVALTLPLWVWAWLISIGALAAKLIMLFGQYVMLRRATSARTRQQSGVTMPA
jgi:intracellular septation protein